MYERTGKNSVGANHPEFSARTPICIPVIHTQADVGALGDAIRRWKVKKLGRKGREHYVKPVNGLRTRIERVIRSLVFYCEQRLVITGGQLVKHAGCFRS